MQQDEKVFQSVRRMEKNKGSSKGEKGDFRKILELLLSF
jgi:hypothetical protein